MTPEVEKRKEEVQEKTGVDEKKEIPPEGEKTEQKFKVEEPELVPVLPTVPVEATTQPMVVALDVPHEWKKAEGFVTVTTENVWQEPEKTKEVIQHLAEETQKSEEHIKELLQQQQTEKIISEDRR